MQAWVSITQQVQHNNKPQNEAMYTESSATAILYVKQRHITPIYGQAVNRSHPSELPTYRTAAEIEAVISNSNASRICWERCSVVNPTKIMVLLHRAVVGTINVKELKAIYHSCSLLLCRSILFAVDR